MKKKAICVFVMLFALLGSFVVYAEISKDTVKEVQNKLNEMGYDCGVADGIAGQHTIEAIQRYQAENGLEVTDEISESLLSSLGIKDVNIPGISVSTFVDRYNMAINEYNQVAERDGYTKAKTISGLSSGTEQYELDGGRAGSITLNDGEKNDYDKVGSFSIYSLTDGWYDKELLTGQIIACIYAFDESLSSFNDAGDLYSQLMTNGSLNNGDIHYHNGSISGFVIVSGRISGFEAAIETTNETKETEKEETEKEEDASQVPAHSVSDGKIGTPEDMAAFCSTSRIGKEVNVLEAFMGIHLNDYPSQKAQQTEMYKVDKGSLFEYACSFEIYVLESNQKINGVKIVLDKNLSEGDFTKIANAITEGLGVEGRTIGGTIVKWENDDGEVSFFWNSDKQSEVFIR